MGEIDIIYLLEWIFAFFNFGELFYFNFAHSRSEFQFYEVYVAIVRISQTFIKLSNLPIKSYLFELAIVSLVQHVKNILSPLVITDRNLLSELLYFIRSA